MSADTNAVIAPWPQPDFAAFGPVETVALPRLQKLVSASLTRNWTRIPHVTHHDHADITELAELRASRAQSRGDKASVLAFTLKAVVAALKAHPRFNASLGADGSSLILKRYYHIGVAVETPNGLIVPVIRDVDRKDVETLTKEIAVLSANARGKGLPISALEGGSFSISSLGSIGGSAFTPIINAPEVAILGTSRSLEQPVRDGDGIEWRTLLPLSLSYDHRVINGADAARFCVTLADSLANAKALGDADQC